MVLRPIKWYIIWKYSTIRTKCAKIPMQKYSKLTKLWPLKVGKFSPKISKISKVGEIPLKMWCHSALAWIFNVYSLYNDICACICFSLFYLFSLSYWSKKMVCWLIGILIMSACCLIFQILFFCLKIGRKVGKFDFFQFFSVYFFVSAWGIIQKARQLTFTLIGTWCKQ